MSNFLKRRAIHYLTIVHIRVHKQRFRKGLLFIIVICGGAHFLYPEIEGVITIILNVAFFYDPIIHDLDEGEADIKKDAETIKKDVEHDINTYA